MSHFSTLVVTKTDSDEELHAALQPFHEVECTGIFDQYVVNVDRLPELKASYETDKATLVIERPDGSKFYAFTTAGDYDPELKPFIKDDRDLKLPEGWKEHRGELLTKDYVSFADYCNYEVTSGKPLVVGDAAPDLEDAHKWGWVRVVGKEVTEAVRRTNPKKSIKPDEYVTIVDCHI